MDSLATINSKLQPLNGKVKGEESWDLLNRPKESNTLVPMKAGHLNFRTFMILFNKLTTAPGLVTKSFKLEGVKKFFAAALKPPAAAALASVALIP